jgi:hypothetical protein
MLIKFLKTFHIIHTWTNWEQFEKHMISKWSGQDFIKRCQSRKCKICNKMQIEDIL